MMGVLYRGRTTAVGVWTLGPIGYLPSFFIVKILAATTVNNKNMTDEFLYEPETKRQQNQSTRNKKIQLSKGGGSTTVAPELSVLLSSKRATTAFQRRTQTKATAGSYCAKSTVFATAGAFLCVTNCKQWQDQKKSLVHNTLKLKYYFENYCFCSEQPAQSYSSEKLS